MNSALDSGDERPCYAFGDFILDRQARRLSDARTGVPVAITGKAFDALLFFVTHPGVVVPRATLTRELWPRSVVEDNNLNKLIAALRRVLDSGAESRYIVTVPGRGYQFVVPVRRVVEVAAPAVAAASEAQQPAGQPPLPSPSDVPKAPTRFTSRRPTWIAVAALVGAAATAFVFHALRGEPPDDGGLGNVTRVAAITSFPGDELSPSLSPDGSQVAFSWNGEDDVAHIYVLPVGESTPLRLTRGTAEDRDPAWSPDSRRIAFLRQRAPQTLDLIVVPALGGPERVLQRNVHMHFVSREGAPRVAWSADGKHVLFTDQRPADAAQESHHLYRLSLEDGVSIPVTQGARVYDLSPALSPDGRRLAFTRFNVDERLSQLMVQSLDAAGHPVGEPQRIAVPTFPLPHSPSWSTDGRRLRFVAGDTLHEWKAGEPPRPVYVSGGLLGGMRGDSTVSALSFDRNPHPLRAVAARAHSSPDLWALPLDPRTHAALGPPVQRAASTASEMHPRLSPDGRQLAFISSRGGNAAVWLADARGESPRQLTSLGAVVSGYPHWSPDGRHIAFHASFVGQERKVYVVDVEGGAPRLVGPGCCAEWSADGRHLWMQEIGDVQRIVRVRVEDGAREPLFVGDLPRESADGRYLIYSKVKEPGLFRRSLEGDIANNPEERLVTDYTPPTGGLAPTADGFFYIGMTDAGAPRSLRFYDYARREARDIARVPRGTSLGMSLSPDGRELIYSAAGQDSGADLVMLEFAQPLRQAD